eukprot:g43554.t1
MPEEQAFCVLVKIMYDYGLRDLYKNNFEDLHCKFYQLERLLQYLRFVTRYFVPKEIVRTADAGGLSQYSVDLEEHNRPDSIRGAGKSMFWVGTLHQDILIQHEQLPELHNHFMDLNLEAHMYASQWFLTLFTVKFPLCMVFHIIDLLLSE